MVLFGHSYHLSPLGGGQESCILSPLHSAEISGAGTGTRRVEGGGAVFCVLSGFSRSALAICSLGCWPMRFPPHPYISFHFSSDFPLGSEAPQGSLMFPQKNIPCPVPCSTSSQEGSSLSILCHMAVWVSQTSLCRVWMSCVGVWMSFSLFGGGERLLGKLTLPWCWHHSRLWKNRIFNAICCIS